MNSQWWKSIALYISGMATMGVIVLLLFGGLKEAGADEYIDADEPFGIDEFFGSDAYSCIRTDLDAQLMTGNIPIDE